MRTPNRLGQALLVAIATALSGSTTAAHAQRRSLLVNTSSSSLYVYGGLHVGGAQWAGMTALINETFDGRLGTTSTLLDLPTMLQYDALWVDQRYQSAPLAAELDNLFAYAATGRRVVVMGENSTWGPWNAAILAAFGGSEGGGCLEGPISAVGTSLLTRGVVQINTACANTANGGLPLFAPNVASLWGINHNVLTILDGNIPDDLFGYVLDGVQFRQNVVEWLDTPAPPATTVASTSALRLRALSAGSPAAALATPEPSTIVLLAGGLLALGGLARRRARHDPA